MPAALPSAALVITFLLCWAAIVPQACADVLLENAKDYNTKKYGKKPFQTCKTCQPSIAFAPRTFIHAFLAVASRPDLHTPIVNMVCSRLHFCAKTVTTHKMCSHVQRRLQPEADPMPDDPFFLVIHGNNVNPWLGSLILNPTDGSPLWITHHWKQMFNLQVQVRTPGAQSNKCIAIQPVLTCLAIQNYQDEPHLTFWDGGYEGGFGRVGPPPSYHVS